MIWIWRWNWYEQVSTKKVAWAAILLDMPYFINAAWTNVTKAGATGIISWVNMTVRPTQLAATDVVDFYPEDAEIEFAVDLSAAATPADIGNYFNITAAANVVDYATKSATSGQLLLTTLPKPKKGYFRIVNK